MGRTKKHRYDTLAHHEMVVQPGSSLYENTAGRWCSEIVPGSSHLVLELACGYGEYTQALSQAHQDRCCIGVDQKGERLRKGSSACLARGQKNARFIRALIHHLDRYFDPGEVDEIRIVHPDPRPKGSDERRRLTSRRFLPMYQKLLRPGGIIRLKTDDADLFAYSLESMHAHGFVLQGMTHDLHQSELLDHHYGVMTHYEKKFVAQGMSVHYARRICPQEIEELVII